MMCQARKSPLVSRSTHCLSNLPLLDPKVESEMHRKELSSHFQAHGTKIVAPTTSSSIIHIHLSKSTCSLNSIVPNSPRCLSQKKTHLNELISAANIAKIRNASSWSSISSTQKNYINAMLLFAASPNPGKQEESHITKYLPHQKPLTSQVNPYMTPGKWNSLESTQNSKPLICFHRISTCFLVGWWPKVPTPPWRMPQPPTPRLNLWHTRTSLNDLKLP